MKRYTVRIKYSAIRSWTVEAANEKLAESIARQKAQLYFLPMATFKNWLKEDKLRTLSIREEQRSQTGEQ